MKYNKYLTLLSSCIACFSFVHGQTFFSYDDTLLGNIHIIKEYNYSFDSTKKELDRTIIDVFYKNNIKHYHVVDSYFFIDSTIYFYDNGMLTKEKFFGIEKTDPKEEVYKSETTYNYFDQDKIIILSTDGFTLNPGTTIESGTELTLDFEICQPVTRESGYEQSLEVLEERQSIKY
jgi:hypothetical protein